MTARTQSRVTTRVPAHGRRAGGEAERFADRYRKAGGAIEIAAYDAPPLFTTQQPMLPQSSASLRRIVSFCLKHI